MKLNIRGDKIKVTSAIKEHIEEKIAKLNRYFENSDEIEAHVIIRIRGVDQIIEVTVPTQKFTLRAEELHPDLYASIDLVVDKLERQIRKNKTRLNRAKLDPIMDLSFTIEPDEEIEEQKIIRRKEVDSKPMGEEEAILQMELLNHDFFVFKNVDEDCISVIYSRKDGHYGIINMR